MTTLRMKNAPLLCFVLLTCYGCPLSRHNPYDNKRCERLCGDGSVCFEGRCTQGDLSLYSDTNFADGSASPDMESVSCPHPVVTATCKPAYGEWCTIPAGCFLMGSPSKEPCRYEDERRHPVYLTRSFLIYSAEVGALWFTKRLGYNPSIFKLPAGAGDYPVENVSWHEAAAFCNALSQLESRPTCYSCTGGGPTIQCTEAKSFTGPKLLDCPGYRLPTEAEWEYAYRAGTKSALYKGDLSQCSGPDPDDIAWYSKNSGASGAPRSQTACGKTPNAWGLCDMAGNVWEWTNDWYEADLGSKVAQGPTGPVTGTERVFRGGAWNSEAGDLRAARRGHGVPSLKQSNLGFRCVRTVQQ